MGLVFSLQECGSWVGSTSDHHDQTLAVISSKVSSTTEQNPMSTLQHWTETHVENSGPSNTEQKPMWTLHHWTETHVDAPIWSACNFLILQPSGASSGSPNKQGSCIMRYTRNQLHQHYWTLNVCSHHKIWLQPFLTTNFVDTLTLPRPTCTLLILLADTIVKAQWGRQK